MIVFMCLFHAELFLEIMLIYWNHMLITHSWYDIENQKLGKIWSIATFNRHLTQILSQSDLTTLQTIPNNIYDVISIEF